MKNQYFSSGFKEWASLFSGEIFVKVVAYIDESGRHSKTASQPGSGQIVVAGWADSPKNWNKFCSQWQTILKDFDAPYFHFYEWADASATIRTGRIPLFKDAGQSPLCGRTVHCSLQLLPCSQHHQTDASTSRSLDKRPMVND